MSTESTAGRISPNKDTNETITPSIQQQIHGQKDKEIADSKEIETKAPVAAAHHEEVGTSAGVVTSGGNVGPHHDEIMKQIFGDVGELVNGKSSIGVICISLYICI